MIPGPNSRLLHGPLRAHESRNVTYLAEDFPVFWESASGATVTDVDGNEYIDVTSAFGVASVGHNNPRVVDAIERQTRALIHGMGDVHPTHVRAKLLERIAQVTPGELNVAFLATSGSEAVEAALKTAALATRRSRFVSFHNAYHGLSLGALTVTGIEKFRAPFAPLIPDVTNFVSFGDADAAIAAIDERVAAVIVEPMQGRAGVIVPPAGFLNALRDACDRVGAQLIFDEIFTGFGRTGRWFACEHDGVIPDMICIGKAMGGGVPISALVGTRRVMDAWPQSTGEALHTSTYLGNPIACAAALAAIDEIEKRDLPARARTLGDTVASSGATLVERGIIREARGRGLMWGFDYGSPQRANAVVTQALRNGVILLQSGPDGAVVAISPPLTISQEQLHHALEVLSRT